jgi:hypothetical protein
MQRTVVNVLYNNNIHKYCCRISYIIKYYKVIDDATTSLSRLLSLRITGMRAAFVQLQTASVLPMHGFDPGEATYTTTKEEGRY